MEESSRMFKNRQIKTSVSDSNLFNEENFSNLRRVLYRFCPKHKDVLLEKSWLVNSRRIPFVDSLAIDSLFESSSLTVHR